MPTQLLDATRQRESCPNCGRTQCVSPGLYICADCSATFAVTPEVSNGN